MGGSSAHCFIDKFSLCFLITIEEITLPKYERGMEEKRPLADRMRPEKLDDFIGQEKILGKGTLLRRAIEEDRVFSMILWGPPGSGKTTLARIIARETSSRFETFSAVLSGVKEIRAVIEKAGEELEKNDRKTVLFVDEIHRFNKAQQDAFLPHVENGLITLIGATTENPSFEVISPLLSRSRVFVLEPFQQEDLVRIMRRALADSARGLRILNIEAEDDALDHMAWAADGDARASLNNLEAAANLVRELLPEKRVITKDIAQEALQKKLLQYDKTGEEHFNLISALHKSLRGSDPDAALYWLARMLDAGEDPMYIARRMIRFASEDIGNADPNALLVSIASMKAFHFIGQPEGELALAQTAVYLATAPKSNSLYLAYGKAMKTVRETGTLAVPMHIRNAPTRLMRDIGYGRGYKYAHDYEDAYTFQDYMPEELRGQTFYKPSDRGYEKTIRQRLEKWREWLKNNS